MRLSHLLWFVALFIVVRAGGTHQHPRMLGKRSNGYQQQQHHHPGGGNHVKRQSSAKIWDSVPDEHMQANAAPCQSSPDSCQPCTSSTTPLPNACEPRIPCQPVLAQQQVEIPMLPQKIAQIPYPLQQQHQQQQQPQQQQPQQQDNDLDDAEKRGKELRQLVQHLYVAQARVQLEATEIHKAQAVATSAQAQLEDSANHVRTITATLHNAQQEVAAAAIRAQIAQLQLAAHDQLLFAARQDVDALSSQVVGLQAAEGIVQPKLTVDLHALLNKLRQPLQRFDCPTPVPGIITPPPMIEAPSILVRQPTVDETMPHAPPAQAESEWNTHSEEIAKTQTQKQSKVARRMAKASSSELSRSQPIHTHHA